MTGPFPDPVLQSARAAAADGAWGDVRAVLEGDPDGTQRDGTRAVLLADACLWTGDPQAASRWLATAIPLLSRAGDRPAVRRSINMQGAAAFALGSLETAADRFDQALGMALTDDDTLLTARATNNLGLIQALRGNAEQAIAAYQRAIMTYQRLGNARGLAESWHNLAISCRTRGELDAAEDAERRAIEYANEAGNPRLAAMAQVGRAEISLRRGDHAWARATASRAAAVFAGVPDYLLQADALRVRADACDRMGLTGEADEAIAGAHALALAHEHRLQEAQALQTHAQMMLRRRDSAEARRIGSEARALFSRIGSVAAAEEMAEFLAALAR
ncbi:MAG: tetratricopeptide repeat protein [Gemmatimonadaceae bacterium]|nr:tetratricopeptide repeat protein [Gemmatimonadaceae bacterium]